MTRLILTALVSLVMGLATTLGAHAASWLDDGERPGEDSSNGNTRGWVNQRTGVVGTFTDAEARPDALGRECREYTFTAQIAGSQQEIFGIACREPDGSWHEASESFEPEREAPAPERYSRQPSEQGYAPYPYGGWDRGYWYPSVGLSASYCFGGVCFGSGYSTGHSGYGYPYDNYGYRNHYGNYYSSFGFSFGNRHHGHNRHYKKHHGRKHHKKRHGRHH